MNLPSIKTLSAVFDNPKAARAILEMTRTQLEQTEAGAARVRACYHPPKTYDVRMHCLNAADPGLHGVESMQSKNGRHADYLNTGDLYAPTVIYWAGRYRVQSVGDFIETQERAGEIFQ